MNDPKIVKQIALAGGLDKQEFMVQLKEFDQNFRRQFDEMKDLMNDYETKAQERAVQLTELLEAHHSELVEQVGYK